MERSSGFSAVLFVSVIVTVGFGSPTARADGSWGGSRPVTTAPVVGPGAPKTSFGDRWSQFWTGKPAHDRNLVAAKTVNGGAPKRTFGQQWTTFWGGAWDRTKRVTSFAWAKPRANPGTSKTASSWPGGTAKRAPSYPPASPSPSFWDKLFHPSPAKTTTSR